MKQEECFNKETENKKKQKQERIDEPLFVNLILINILIFLLSGAFALSLFVFLLFKPVDKCLHKLRLIYNVSAHLARRGVRPFYK